MKRTIITLALTTLVIFGAIQAMFQSSVPRVPYTKREGTVYLTQETPLRRDRTLYEGRYLSPVLDPVTQKWEQPYGSVQVWSDRGKNFRVFGVWNGKASSSLESVSTTESGRLWDPNDVTECVEEKRADGSMLYECTGNGDKLSGKVPDEERFHNLEDKAYSLLEERQPSAADVAAAAAM
jgi:hypothetical protein